MERTPTPGSTSAQLRDMSRAEIRSVTTGVFHSLDADGDGALQPEEFQRLGLSGNRQRKAWKQLDARQNGIITPDEFESFFQAAAADSGETDDEEERGSRRTQLAWMVDQMQLDLNRLTEEEREEEEEEDIEDELMRVHRKPPMCARNLAKWMAVDFEGVLWRTV